MTSLIYAFCQLQLGFLQGYAYSPEAGVAIEGTELECSHPLGLYPNTISSTVYGP